jgi:hypothetical protein
MGSSNQDRITMTPANEYRVPAVVGRLPARVTACQPKPRTGYLEGDHHARPGRDESCSRALTNPEPTNEQWDKRHDGE